MTFFIPSSSASVRQRIGVIAALVALLGALLTVGGGVASASADTTGSISGTVQGAGSSDTALSGAYVFLYTTGQQWVSSTTTDDGGNFSFTGLAVGSYTLDFQAPDGANFAEQWWNGESNGFAADYFSLSDGQSLTGMNVVLAVGSTLSGSVSGVGSPNAPIPNGFAELYPTNGGAAAFASTDSQGNFTIQGIGAGTYSLEFSPPFNSTTYVPQWWQNQSEQANAQTITIGAGQTLTGYNAVLPFGASISGTVVGADTSAGLAGASVQAIQSGGPTGFATVAADGSYTLEGLVPGSYTIEFSPAYNTNFLAQYWNDKPTAATADTITVAGGEALTGINATLAVGGTVSGTVTTIETPETGLENATAYAVDSTDTYVQGVATDADGNYSIVGLSPGTYRIQFQPPYGDSHATQYWNQATTFDKATPIIVGANTAATGINATLRQGATISGTVTEADDPSTPIPNADVEAETPSGTYVADAYADDSGNYTMTDLPAGTFVVEFTGSLDVAYTSSFWQNASKLSAATRIKLTAGSAITGIDGTVARAYLTPRHPTISGSAKVGGTLTAKPGKWKPSGTTFTYQWNRDGSAISGATNSTYAPVNADAGQVLTVSVTGDYFNYDDVTVTSGVTKVVTGGTLTTVVPEITGTPIRGSQLTAVLGTWGPGTVALTFRWNRDGTKISGATGSTYTVTKADAGKQITVTVTGSETGFTTASQSSVPMGPAS
jgi:hypothetical protein